MKRIMKRYAINKATLRGVATENLIEIASLLVTANWIEKIIKMDTPHDYRDAVADMFVSIDNVAKLLSIGIEYDKDGKATIFECSKKGMSDKAIKEIVIPAMNDFLAKPHDQLRKIGGPG